MQAGTGRGGRRVSWLTRVQAPAAESRANRIPGSGCFSSFTLDFSLPNTFLYRCCFEGPSDFMTINSDVGQGAFRKKQP